MLCCSIIEQTNGIIERVSAAYAFRMSIARLRGDGGSMPHQAARRHRSVYAIDRKGSSYPHP
jgi:hypothetical protein